ncbi:bifunctional hydroxymethylpyrimidine kinase/phosphomethylpyrimidine kinase [Sansalvadorimonas verongulae]|uniref:bifunctional hydroxymethylpyrimidine kinase/phosphomethylpyrimidine kinase n=1 Tax=Sansalvadorimonas verongulae TaxID=2172824 RepID=UPI0012BC834B|nr:bifunctional hydroxymethylpyrimidine kinase/phosphomethylpyrimidine kinase [Sansalvadorimonas verongulae]MTI14605.1 bifunctional hydroxymethylpyrimidine kinase/phosphomethylpyrimidine kinase [Sansalvadorimonas verongulae]
MNHTPIALTIAGSDSGGGAGIQADLKAFSALGAYGCSVITALTAQNTQGVQGIFDTTPEFVRMQMDSVFSDLTVNAVKIGMLSQEPMIRAVAEGLDAHSVELLVVDPVMVATSGDKLLQDNAINTLKECLIPKATVITPNLPEAAVLLDTKVPESIEEMAAMVEPLLALGSRAVLIKGGHLGSEESVDLFHDGEKLHRLTSPRYPTENTHGTGCTLSSAITALLAQGVELTEAVKQAKDYIAQAIAHADELDIGSGHGPVHHFHALWKNKP